MLFISCGKQYKSNLKFANLSLAYLSLAAAAAPAPAEPGDKIVNEIIDDDDGRRR